MNVLHRIFNTAPFGKSLAKAVSVMGILAMLTGTLFSVRVLAYDIPEQTDAFYVEDFAGLLTQETADYIVTVNEQLYGKCGAQVVVATIDTLDNVALEEYATAMFRQYGIGSADENNGILILLALQERQCRVEVGYGLEGAINDAKAGRIMDEFMIPYFKEDNWNDGMKNGFNAIVAEICTEYNIEITDREEPQYSEETLSSMKWDEFENQGIWGMVIALVAGLIIGITCKKKAFIPSLTCLGLGTTYFGIEFGVWYAIIAFIAIGLALLIGWAMTSPNEGYSSSGSGSSSSRSSHSSYSGGSSSHSGGGGSSGGGGASRGF